MVDDPFRIADIVSKFNADWTLSTASGIVPYVGLAHVEGRSSMNCQWQLLDSL